MKLYFTQTCAMVAPVLLELDQYKLEYELINIDEDINSKNQLRYIANGFLSVPTLELPDGRVFIEVTPSQIEDLFGKVEATPPPSAPIYEPDAYQQALEQTIQRWAKQAAAMRGVYYRWLIGGVLVAFAAGLGVFGFGFTFGQEQTLISPATLMWGMVGVMVASVLILLIPPISARGRAIQTTPYGAWVTGLGLIAYTGLMGMGIGSALGVSERTIPLTAWLASLFGLVILLILVSILTRLIWIGWRENLIRWQGRVGLAAMVLFMAILILQLIGESVAVLVLLSRVVLLGALLFALLVGCLQAAVGFPQKQAALQSSSLLYPSLGLLLWLAML